MILMCYGQEKALLQVIYYESEIETYEYELTGHFSAVGTVGAAEGIVKLSRYVEKGKRLIYLLK